MRFQLFYVQVHAKFTKRFTVPSYEVPVILSAWPGVEYTVTEMADFRDVHEEVKLVYGLMCGIYGTELVKMYYPGPERLALDMQTAHNKSAEVEKKFAHIAEEAQKELAAGIAFRAAASQADAEVAAQAKMTAEAKARIDAETAEATLRQRLKDEIMADLTASGVITTPQKQPALAGKKK